MKKLAKQTFLILMAISSALIVNSFIAHAGSSLELSSTAFRQSGLPTPADGQSGQQITESLARGLLGYVKVLLGVIGIVYGLIAGARLVIAGAEEESVSKAKNSLLYIAIGFVLLSMSEDIARIFDMRNESLLGSPQSILQRTRLFERQVELFITFTKAIISFVAILMLVRSGARMVTLGADEEAISKEKKQVVAAVFGLILINAGGIFIDRVFYNISGSYSGIDGVNVGIDADEGVSQIASITNLVVSFLGPVAVLMLIIGGVMYLTAGGDEEKANRGKRLLLTTAIGMLIIFGAFALVSTVISSRLANLGAIN